MLITASCALAVLASSPAAAAAVNRTLPPIVVAIAVEAGVPRSVVRLAQAEAEEIFRGAGVRFLWRDHAAPAVLVVAFENDPGPEREVGITPLGWLMFENGEPTPKIHLSFANAQRYLAGAREVVGVLQTKTIAERETLLGRLMGRALAHELAHYLLGSKEHTRKGLLKGSPTAQEFFSPTRGAFQIDAIERRELAGRLSGTRDLARLIPWP